ncbi:MAG: M15 family metallopeptidase [Defluviitaleaceae bacterium]|nr:M15 family metallopeptidase [Defluviitaleaceae bacterium]
MKNKAFVAALVSMASLFLAFFLWWGWTAESYYTEDMATDEPVVLESPPPTTPAPTYYIPQFVPLFTAEPLPAHIIDFITGITFHDNTPFGYDFLSYLTISHVDFDGEDRIGHMIVAAEIAGEVLDIFKEIYEARFPIHSIKLIDYFDADDYLSLMANNSSAFNFRYIAGTNIISRHGFGMAIDINPIQNPYARGETIKPAIGAQYLDRAYIRPGMIVPGDAVYTAFTSRGWTWGGNWTWPKDYHHFERR